MKQKSSHTSSTGESKIARVSEVKRVMLMLRNEALLLRRDTLYLRESILWQQGISLRHWGISSDKRDTGVPYWPGGQVVILTS